MSRDSGFVEERAALYAAAHSLRPSEVQLELIEETASLGRVAGMQIGPLQGAFMTVLATALRPRLAVEVGTFTGYSALCVASALDPGAQLICCDVSEEWTSIARRYWERAGVADRIDLRIGPALDTLRALSPEPLIDLAFIDADKFSYPDYYDEIFTRLSPGGVILVDNVLWGGAVADRASGDETAEAMRAFNKHVAADERTRTVLLPIGDGLTMITRRLPA
ncbi:O-methyltransferase [Candidatus Poriferisodalis sp.]|uniref:O-methyltransferase n=1 Tax=Candidatus Poriferisodalis sp. TaxID=3101277 RepID=UPI003B5CE736